MWDLVPRPGAAWSLSHGPPGKSLHYRFYPPLQLGEGSGTPLQYSCLENPMGGGAWKAAVHGVAKSQTRLSDFTVTFHLHALEEEMATHSSVLAWRIPGTGKPGGLPSMRLHRVGHDWSDLAAAAAWLQSHWGPQLSRFMGGFLNIFMSVDKARGMNHPLDFCYPVLKNVIVSLILS